MVFPREKPWLSCLEPPRRVLYSKKRTGMQVITPGTGGALLVSNVVFGTIPATPFVLDKVARRVGVGVGAPICCLEPHTGPTQRSLKPAPFHEPPVARRLL